MPAGRKLALFGAPLRSSLATEGTEGASAPLRSFAVTGAKIAGIDVTDEGDIPLPLPGTSDFVVAGSVPKNEGRVRESLLTVSSRIADSVRAGATPAVFGGDATVLLGLIAGLHDAGLPSPRTGLLALDGLARFQTATGSSGELSEMVLALATGRGDVTLAHLARDRFPLVQETDVLLAGVRDASAEEAASLVASRVTLFTPERLFGAGGEALFMEALGRLASRTRDFVLHLDVSVLDPSQFPVAVGAPSPGGLSLVRLKTLVGELSTWISDGTVRISGVSVTGLDARKDPGAVRMHELAGFVIRLFGGRGGGRT